MALTYTQAAAIAIDPIFLQRVFYAMEVGAVTVIAEATNTPKHSSRVNFANQVLYGRFDNVSLAYAIMTQLAPTSSATTQADILDSDIQTVINNNWNIIGGI